LQAQTSNAAPIVWCASFPKSGNTWLRALLAGAFGDGTVLLSNLAGRASDADQGIIFHQFGIPPSILDDALAEDLTKEAAVSMAMQLDEPIFRKSHECFDGAGANSIHTLRVPCRAIYVVRDPRAVVPSLAHHMGVSQKSAVKMMGTSTAMAAERRAENLLNARGLVAPDRYRGRGTRIQQHWGDWSENVTSWLDQDELPLSLVRYEDLSADAESVMKNVFDELELDVPGEKLKQAVEESSFDRLMMQEIFEGFGETVAANRHFFRRGEVDSWREELEDGLEQEVISAHGEVMERLGYVGQ
jgi:aryl sulfotransferase